MSSNLLIIICVALLCFTQANSLVHRRFEYKYSFKPPYLAQKDGTVPFFDYGGNAIASGESVRLAPSLRSQKGAIWAKNPVTFDHWEVDLMFKVTGRGRIGADGLAFWYTSERGEYTGEVFGSSDRWRGLAVIFDSFDNDNKHNNPYIMAVLNDGTKVFDHKSDGSQQMVSGCLRDFRNKPFPTRARIEYYQNTLTVYFHNGMTSNEADYELCFRAENVRLPAGGYFGVSAATGGLADDHDVIHLLTTSLHEQGAPQGGAGAGGGASMTADEQAKLSAEYAEYQKKLERQKEDYRKDHPDEVRDKEGEFDDWFESDGQRELRQIFQGQGRMHDALRDLNTKLDEVIGKQMNSLSVLSALYTHAQGQPLQPAPAQQGQVGGVGGLPVGRHEWDALASNSQILVNTVAELKGFMIEVSRKSDALLAGGAAGAGPASAAAGAAGAAGAQLAAEVRDSLHQIKQTVAAVAQRLSQPQLAAHAGGAGVGGAGGAGGGCPSATCVGLWGVLAVAGLQLGAMLLYALYKERKEAQAKKFF